MQTFNLEGWIVQPEQPKGSANGRHLLHFLNADKAHGKADTFLGCFLPPSCCPAHLTPPLCCPAHPPLCCPAHPPLCSCHPFSYVALPILSYVAPPILSDIALPIYCLSFDLLLCCPAHLTPPLPALTLSADTSDMQFTWVSSLESSGVTVLPLLEDQEDLVRKATSIFDFEVKDIDGNVVSLEKYRYEVLSRGATLTVT